MTGGALPQPITALEMAAMVRRCLGVALSADVLEDEAAGVAGDGGCGEFAITAPATRQRFRIVVTEASPDGS